MAPSSPSLENNFSHQQIALALRQRLDEVKAMDLPGHQRLELIEQAHMMADRLRRRLRERSSSMSTGVDPNPD